MSGTGELSRISNMYQTIRKNIVANKKPIILGGLGLAATAMILGSEKPEMTKETLPYSTGNDTLPPMQSENAHVFKKKEYRQTANIKARHHEKGSAGSKIRRDTFGQNHGGRTNIPYRDWETDRKSTRLNSSHSAKSRMPSSA